MARVTYYVACSIDGFIAPDDGSLDWLAPFSGTGEDHGYADFYSAIDSLIVGARTYEQMLSMGGWPHLDRATVVMSSRSLKTPAENVTVGHMDPASALKSLAASGHHDVWLIGGGALAGSFDMAGLINEYVISYVPVILGSGVGLFGRRTQAHSLGMVAQRSFADGIVQCQYRAEGQGGPRDLHGADL